jgi:hypothetical protein
MVFLKFSSPHGDIFEMGCLIMLGNDKDDDIQRYVVGQVRNWIPEERWNRFFGQDGSPLCVTFRYRGFRMSASYCKLPHYEGEIFCLVEPDHQFPRDAYDVEMEAYSKFYHKTAREP